MASSLFGLRTAPTPWSALREASSDVALNVTDTLDRPLRSLRISVTDRCNFRCAYCMPKEVFGRDYRFLPRRLLLTFEEITRLARIFIAHGVEKIRVTGGEPLLSPKFDEFLPAVMALGLADVSVTTNGQLIQRKADLIIDSGLKRINVSLDTLNAEKFRAIARSGTRPRSALKPQQTRPL